MSDTQQLQFIYEELKVFSRNLRKENEARRLDLRVIDNNICKLNRISNDFKSIKINLNDQDDLTKQQLSSYLTEIKNSIESISKLLQDRCRIAKEQVRVGDSVKVDLETKMGDKFDLKVAASLLPTMNGKEDVTKQLIDAIELYDGLLDADGKKMLTTYVLKTKLTQSAKLRLKTVYQSNKDLISDIKLHLLPRKSAAALSFELHNAKQNQKSIDDFGKTIEELMVNLTLVQADGDEDTARILSNINEKIAISAFSNGLRDHDLKMLIKARNYTSIQSAIVGAKDEDVAKRSSTSQVFSIGKRGNFRGSNFRYVNNDRNNTRPRTSNYNNSFNNKNKSYNNSNSNSSYRGTTFNRGYNRHGRGNYSNFRGQSQRRSYFINDSGANTSPRPTTSTEIPETFFRAPPQ